MENRNIRITAILLIVSAIFIAIQNSDMGSNADFKDLSHFIVGLNMAAGLIFIIKSFKKSK